jgi:glycine cleavage system H lipoate-binding protein
LTDGQKIQGNNGYSILASGESNSKLEKLIGRQFITLQPEDNYAGWKIAIMVIILSIVVALIIETAFLVLRGRSKDFTGTSRSHRVFDENAVESPGGLFFDKTHTWAFMENDGRVKVGVDDFLAHITGQLTRVKLKKPGDTIKKNEVLLSIIQNGKQLTIKSPVSGTIIEENISLKGDPSLINTSPYRDGWVYLVKPENWLRELQFLFMADKFKIWLNSEFIRLKDFIAFVRKSGDESYIPLVLQEGGEIKEGVLMNFGPEVWEDFQADFIDKTA